MACSSAVLGLYFSISESYLSNLADGRVPDDLCTMAAGRVNASIPGAGGVMVLGGTGWFGSSAVAAGNGAKRRVPDDLCSMAAGGYNQDRLGGGSPLGRGGRW